MLARDRLIPLKRVLGGATRDACECIEHGSAQCARGVVGVGANAYARPVCRGIGLVGERN